MSDIVIKISQKLARELYSFAMAPRIVVQTMSNESRKELAEVMHPVVEKTEKAPE